MSTATSLLVRQTRPPLTGSAAATGRALPLAPAATLPAELMPDINAGETGYRDYVSVHPLGREAFEESLAPGALSLWRDAQGSMDTMRARISSLQTEQARLPGRFAGMLQEPDVQGGVAGGLEVG